MGIDLALPSVEQIRSKLGELVTKRKETLDQIRKIYKVEINRWNALLKVAEQVQKKCEKDVSIEVDPDADSIEIESD